MRLTKNYVTAEQREVINEVLSKEVNGNGGFQSLMRRFQGAFDNGHNPVVTPSVPSSENEAMPRQSRVSESQSTANGIQALVERMLEQRLAPAVDKMIADALGNTSTHVVNVPAVQRAAVATVQDDDQADPTPRKRRKSRRRANAMRASWANLSTAARKRRVAAMVAGRLKARHGR